MAIVESTAKLQFPYRPGYFCTKIMLVPVLEGVVRAVQKIQLFWGPTSSPTKGECRWQMHKPPQVHFETST